jgi:hypothetical protein
VGCEPLSLLFIFIGAIAVLLFVTRMAGRRDAVKKAERARHEPAPRDDG